MLFRYFDRLNYSKSVFKLKICNWLACFLFIGTRKLRFVRKHNTAVLDLTVFAELI